VSKPAMRVAEGVERPALTGTRPPRSWVDRHIRCANRHPQRKCAGGWGTGDHRPRLLDPRGLLLEVDAGLYGPRVSRSTVSRNSCRLKDDVRHDRTISVATYVALVCEGGTASAMMNGVARAIVNVGFEFANVDQFA
jgi:hypothetical protein